MQGSSFIGSDSPARKFVFGTRDRVDEVFDCARSIRDRRWLYIRNFHPHLGWGQPSVFSDLGAIRASIREHASTPAQTHFTGATRVMEELYDCQTDPENLKNLLAGDTPPEAIKALARFARILPEPGARRST